ncbi:MAG: hypothetical protein WAP23_03565 [Candidatus Spechtbacterales bacterium]
MNTAFLLIFTLFSLVSFTAILFGSDPYSAALPLRILFFTTLFFSFLGLFSLSSIGLSKLFGRSLAFGGAFRRGLLFSLLVSTLIMLETFSALNIVNAIAVFLVVVAVEAVAILRNPPRPILR